MVVVLELPPLVEADDPSSSTNGFPSLPSAKFTVASETHPWKAPAAIEDTVLGTTIVLRPLHPLNNPVLIVFNPTGSSNVVSAFALYNAFSPISNDSPASSPLKLTEVTPVL